MYLHFWCRCICAQNAFYGHFYIKGTSYSNIKVASSFNVKKKQIFKKLFSSYFFMQPWHLKFLMMIKTKCHLLHYKSYLEDKPYTYIFYWVAICLLAERLEGLQGELDPAYHWPVEMMAWPVARQKGLFWKNII